jgi:mono/diheme cytochrome c family protein
MQAFCKGLIVLASSTPFGMALLAGPKQDDQPVTFLPQGWSRGTSERFHYAPQGSELVPYYWFLNLMEPDGETLLKDNLKQYGVLYDNPSPGIKHHNPDGLPIGFARQDESRTLGGITEKHWLGFTCAACHTGALVPKAGSNPVKQGPIIIDGAPAKFDAASFLTKLQASVQATDSDPLRLHTLAEKAFAAGDGNSVEEIEVRFHNYTRQLNKIMPLYLPTTPSGPGRLDCFGAIINRVCVFDIKSDQPSPAKLDAPVDFPFIWYTDRQSQIQWFGELPNSNWFDRLARNAGEVSGVFAQVVVKPKASLDGYPSSLNALGLGWIDQSVSSLTAPKWTDVFPAPDPAAVKRGKSLFKPTCQAGGCHRDLAPKNKVFDVAPTPLVQDPAKNPYHLPDLNTDENNTKMIHTTLSETGILLQTPTGGKIVSPSPATSLVGDIVVGELIGAKKDVFEAYVEYLVDKFFHVSIDKATTSQKVSAKGKMKADITKKVMAAYKLTKRDKPTAPLTSIPFDPRKAGYESRSMNGMWVTAPYLHNGSIPDLVQLLWPEKRTATFYVGSVVYDPQKVGYVSDGTAGGTLFDTSAPGSSNKGHTYGAKLTNAQKYDLIAYLKTL